MTCSRTARRSVLLQFLKGEAVARGAGAVTHYPEAENHQRNPPDFPHRGRTHGTCRDPQEAYLRQAQRSRSRAGRGAEAHRGRGEEVRQEKLEEERKRQEEAERVRRGRKPSARRARRRRPKAPRTVKPGNRRSWRSSSRNAWNRRNCQSAAAEAEAPTRLLIGAAPGADQPKEPARDDAKAGQSQPSPSERQKGRTTGSG